MATEAAQAKVTMLDCIRRVPSILNAILGKEGQGALCDAVFQKFEPGKIDELYFIGSGTSYNGCATARYLAEEASGVRVSVAPPGEFLRGRSVRNPDALYVFVSQTGTSTELMEALAFANAQGFKTLGVSEAAGTPIAKAAGAYLDMGCGKEEFGMRTIGYSSTVLTLTLLGVELGARRGTLTAQAKEGYLAQAAAASANLPAVIDAALLWMDRCKRNILRSSFIAFTGEASLYGVAQEAAVKVWEAPQYPAAGYELDEGTHGPNYGYDHNVAVVVLNGGGAGEKTALALARYMKNELHNGYIVGKGAIDDNDLAFEPKGGSYACLEFAAAIQVFMYRLAVDGGRDFSVPPTHTVMDTYFSSHTWEKPPEQAS